MEYVHGDRILVDLRCGSIAAVETPQTAVPQTLPETFPTVEIRPIELLGEAKDMLGDRFWLFVGICAVGMLIGGAVPFGILLGPMMVGIHLCLIRQQLGGEVKFELLFKGFDYFIQSLVVMLIMMGISMAVMVPIYVLMFLLMGMLTAAAGSGGQDAAGAMGAMMGIASIGLWVFIMVIMLAITTLFAFAIPLVIDQDMKAMDAIKTSYRAVRANLVGMLMLTFVCGLITFVAALLCYLPAFLVLPITLTANFLAYRKIFPHTKVHFDEEGMPINPDQAAPATR